MESTVEVGTAEVEAARRAESIRHRLPGQMRRERLEEARLRYGPLYTLTQVRNRVSETLPRRLGYVRSTAFEPIETYGPPIPDDALLKYDDALLTGLFESFLVATPRYYERVQTDPWIIAAVTGTELFAVIAQWDDA
jgi:hypothetical protein